MQKLVQQHINKTTLKDEIQKRIKQILNSYVPGPVQQKIYKTMLKD